MFIVQATGSTVVEHTTHNPMVKGSDSAYKREDGEKSERRIKKFRLFNLEAGVI
jgi:hypothetical protein